MTNTRWLHAIWVDALDEIFRDAPARWGAVYKVLLKNRPRGETNLRGCIRSSGALLRAIIAADVVSHEWLDRLEGAAERTSAPFVRRMLIEAGFLEARDECTIQDFDTWSWRYLWAWRDYLNERDFQIIKEYLHFHLLAGWRQRRRRTTMPTHRAALLRAIIAFCRYLKTKSWSLRAMDASARVRWPGNRSKRVRIAAFLGWVHDRYAMAGVRPVQKRVSPSYSTLEQPEINGITQRLFHDESIPLRYRVPALLSLYGLQLRQIRFLEKADIRCEDGKTIEIAGFASSGKVILDGEAAALVLRQVVDVEPSPRGTRRHCSSRWLLPGRDAAKPVSENGLTHGMSRYGLSSQRLRTTFLLWAAERSTMFFYVARSLGFSSVVTADWLRAAAGDRGWLIAQPPLKIPRKEAGGG